MGLALPLAPPMPFGLVSFNPTFHPYPDLIDILIGKPHSRFERSDLYISHALRPPYWPASDILVQTIAMSQNPRAAMNIMNACRLAARNPASSPVVSNIRASLRRSLHTRQQPTTPISSTPSRRITSLYPAYPTRPFSTTPLRQHGDLKPPLPGQERHITFIEKDSSRHTFTVADGDNLLDIAQANDLEMEGACGGSCACSTCHCIVEGGDSTSQGGDKVSAEAMYDKMEEPSDDENDMLDLAFGLTETSRLGCQVVMSKELDGLVVKLPTMTRNMQASDFAEKK
jgi:ferredoxin